MQLKHYTADAICHSMCIGPLVDPSWESGTLAIRLLLKPSFHPEACITIVRRENAASLDVTVLTEMLWQHDYPCRLPAHHDHCHLTMTQFTRLAYYHHEAATDLNAGRTVCVDGMGINCVWKSGNTCDQFQSNVVDQSLRLFVAQMIDHAWHNSTNAGVRNGLAQCARYLGAEYPADSVASEPTLFRLGVFGTADDVDEYFRILRLSQNEG